MKIGLLSDAHGNFLALEQCLTEITRVGVDRLHFLGDAVGYLPGEVEVLTALRRASAICQKGNHEAMLLGEAPTPPERADVYRLAGARERLTKFQRDELRAWPESRSVAAGGRELLLVHGSPTDPLTGYIYPDSDLSSLADLPYDAVFMGNTHRPFVRHAGNVLVVNVGSCGLPRDRGDLLSFAVYDSQAHDCSVFRVPFDQQIVMDQFGAEAIADEVRRVMVRSSAATPYGQLVREGNVWTD